MLRADSRPIPLRANVVVDADKLAVHAPKIAEHGGSPEGWITSALDEEVKHGMQVKAHGPVFRPHYTALHAQLSDEDKKILEQVYPDDKDPAYQAAELQRMIMQHRSGGTITEAHHRDISSALPLITGPQSPEMEASIEKVLAAGEPQAAPEESREALVERIDKALAGMREKGATEGDEHYDRLQAKRDAISEGEPVRGQRCYSGSDRCRSKSDSQSPAR